MGLVLSTVFFSLTQQHQNFQFDSWAATSMDLPTMMSSAMTIQTALSSGGEDPTTSTTTTQTLSPPNKSPGRQIMEEAYARTYQVIQDECGSPQDSRLDYCLERLYLKHRKHNSTTLPWWFRTLLRDGRAGSPLHGGWHNLSLLLPSLPSSSDNTTNTQVNVCTMEKIGSTEWRRIQCAINSENVTGPDRNVCHPRRELLRPHMERITFLRDPLTRFLSGFLDKCTSPNRGQRHCEPDRLFWYNKDKKKGALSKKSTTTPNASTTLVQPPPHRDDNLIVDFENDKRLFFHMYMDVVPLKWNVHFFPQALYCNGLYRTLPDYKFVGEMGPHYQEHLHRIANHYGSPLKEAMTVQFKLKPPQESVATTTTMTNKNHHNSRSQKSARLVREYYTSATLRKALEYMSIDYITLGLELPEWVDEILLQDEQQQQQPEQQHNDSLLVSTTF